MAELTPLGGTAEKPDISLTNVKTVGPAENQPPQPEAPPAPKGENPPQPPVESAGIETTPAEEIPLSQEEIKPPITPSVEEGTAGLGNIFGKIREYAEQPTKAELMMAEERAKRFAGIAGRLQSGALNVGQKTLKFDMSQLGDSTRLQALIEDVAGEYKAAVLKAKRGIISDAELQALATETGSSEQEIAQLVRGTTLKAEKVLAAKRVFGAVAQRVLSTRDEIQLAGAWDDPASQKLLIDQVAILVDAAPKVMGVGSELGRALRAWGLPVQGFDAGANIAAQVNGIADPTGKGRMRLLEMLRNIGSPGQLEVFANLWSTGKNALVEAWINSLLSGPQTQLSNAAGNIALAVNGVLERQIAGVWGAAFEAVGKQRGIQLDEATQMMRASLDAMSDANRAFARMMITEEPTFDLANKFDTNGFKRAISAEAFGASGAFGKYVDTLGTVINLPRRGMMSTDEWFKVFNFQIALRAEATRVATQEGLSGQAWGQRVSEIMTDPTAFKTAWDNARNYGKYTTLNRELGPFGSWLRKGANSNTFMKIILPFTTVPANITHYTFERTPVLNVLSAGLVSDLFGTNGPVARDLAFAKVSTGAIGSALIARATYAGYITGRGPIDANLRSMMNDMGWQPYSIWDPVNKEYVSIDRTDPLGMFISVVADTTQILTQLPEHDAMYLAAGTAVALSGILWNKTYMKGFADVMSALEESKRGNPESQTIKSVLNQYAASAIPASGLSRTIARQFDPEVKDIRTWQDAVYATLPGYSKNVYPRRDIYGRPKLMEGGWGPDIASPMRVSTPKDEPALAFMASQGISIYPFSRALVGPQPQDIQVDPLRAAKVQGSGLTDEEYNRWGQILQSLKIGGKTLKERLDSIVTQPGWQERQTLGPQGTASVQLKAEILMYRETAKARLFKERPEIEKRIQGYYEEKAKALRRTPQSVPSPNQTGAQTGPIAPGVQRLTQ